jgi:hypothetical protein
MKRRDLLVLILAAIALWAAQELVRARAQARASNRASAAWIWRTLPGRRGAPTVVFAAKDFKLGFEPIQAQLEIAADEEYHLMLNGHGVAAGRYQERLDSYPVGDALRRGGNRIVVELRSARGAGGLFLRLHVTGGRGESATIVSDGSWRIMHQWVAGVSLPTSQSWGEPVQVWGTPPSGRWLATSKIQPTLTTRRLQGGKRLKPLRAVRSQRLGERWQPAEPFAAEPLGPWVTFDFGRELAGYVNLRFADTERSDGFVFYGLRRPRAGLENPDEVIIRARGRNYWTSAAPASFRFVTVVGLPDVTAGEVVPIVPELIGDLAQRPPVTPLFGIDRELTLVSPVEDEVRGKLEGVTGLAGREEG